MFICINTSLMYVYWTAKEVLLVLYEVKEIKPNKYINVWSPLRFWSLSKVRDHNNCWIVIYIYYHDSVLVLLLLLLD